MHGEVERELPTPESAELLAVVRQLAHARVAPFAVRYEAEGRFPREVFTKLGEVGLLGLPYPEEYGERSNRLPSTSKSLRELASAWLSVALGSASTHSVRMRWQTSVPMIEVGAAPGHDRRRATRGLLPVGTR